MLITVLETPEYLKRGKNLFKEKELSAIVFYLSSHPKAGEIIVGTGGIRKLRWAISGKGKRGGVRIIYYYHNVEIPLVLLTVFSKNEKANLNMAERNELKTLVKQYSKQFKKRKTI